MKKNYPHITSLVLTSVVGVIGVWLLLVNFGWLSYQIVVVESGSMAPTIPIGSMVAFSPAESYTVGDVIVFQREGEEVSTTHRIVAESLERGREVFKTKGDANLVLDSQSVSRAEVLGRVVWQVPFVGLVMLEAWSLGLLLVMFSVVWLCWRWYQRRVVHSRLSIKPKSLVLIGLLLLSTLPVGAEAYFTSQTRAEDNSLTVGTLGLSLGVGGDSVLVPKTGTTEALLLVGDTGSIAAQYQISSEITECDIAVGEGLGVSFEKETPIYAGLFGELVGNFSDPGTWRLVLSLDESSSAMVGAECVVDLTVTAWQEEFSDPDAGGFSDSKTVSLTITIVESGPTTGGNVILNEIYPKPDTASSTPLNVEWVELFNPTDQAVDVSGWSVGELTGSGHENNHVVVESCVGQTESDHIQPYGTSGTVIPPGGLLVLTFCGSASYLNDGGDTVSLYVGSGELLDQYAYVGSTSGKSIARIPDGAEWVDPVPTPGSTNTATVSELEEAGWSIEAIERVVGQVDDEVFNTTEKSTANEGLEIIETPVPVDATLPEIENDNNGAEAVGEDVLDTQIEGTTTESVLIEDVEEESATSSLISDT